MATKKEIREKIKARYPHWSAFERKNREHGLHKAWPALSRTEKKNAKSKALAKKKKNNTFAETGLVDWSKEPNGRLRGLRGRNT